MPVISQSIKNKDLIKLVGQMKEGEVLHLFTIPKGAYIVKPYQTDVEFGVQYEIEGPGGFTFDVS